MGLFSRYTKARTSRSMHLDNPNKPFPRSESEDQMPLNNKKIRREVCINGAKVWVTANTEQEYANKLLRLSGSSQEPGMRHNFKEYANRWFYGISQPNVAEVTANTYRRQLNYHIFPVLGDRNIEEIDSFLIQQVFNRLSPDAKQDTKNKIKNVLNQIFKMAAEEGLIRRNPMLSSSLRIKGQAATVTEPYSVADMRFFAAHLDDLSEPIDRGWLALSVCLPLRPEEVLGLQWRDIDEVNGVIHIRNTVSHPDRNRPVFRTYTKTASSVRTLAIPAWLIQRLPQRGLDLEFVIGGESPVSYTQLRWMRKRIAAQIGYPGTITPRRFRTTVATDISAMTHDLKLVQHMLGHATPQMTLKHYDKGRSTTVDGVQAIEQCYGF